jgi:hypothetical protein
VAAGKIKTDTKWRQECQAFLLLSVNSWAQVRSQCFSAKAAFKYLFYLEESLLCILWQHPAWGPRIYRVVGTCLSSLMQDTRNILDVTGEFHHLASSCGSAKKQVLSGRLFSR